MKFIIDYLKWRCGGNDESENKLGKGVTALLNPEGYMCCLGQCALQTKYNKDDIYSRGSPSELEKGDGILTFNIKGSSVASFMSSNLSTRAIGINDDRKNTPKNKIKLLTNLFTEYGHEIEFINVPN